uniref:Uncharacterized protein n=1 Tax=Globisporangium ultimum (strain ATCC 200006 / CBS 805.95 / DAOM BR144) TaxID=431595 RepID=K3WWM5_GLOUD
MGVENSRIVAGTPLSWQTVQYGIHYASTDVAVWPQLVPLTQWFTTQDALALKASLNQRTTSSMLTYQEFVAWLQNGRQPVALHQPSRPTRLDIMTPPPLPQHQFNPANPAKSEQGGTATAMLEMYLGARVPHI